MADDLFNGFLFLLQICFLESTIEIIVERGHFFGKFRAFFDIQTGFEFANDGLGFLKVLVDGQIELEGILVFKAFQSNVGKLERAIK